MIPHSRTVTIKRGNKMTKHYVRGSIIWLNYYVDGVRKQKSTKLMNTPENIKIVTSKIIPSLDAKIATGEIYKKTPKTFEYYGDIFLKQKSENNNYKQVKSFTERVVTHFGSLNINEITRLDIKQYLLSLKIKSKNPFKTVLCGIFELAVDDAVISINPALNIKLPSSAKKVIEYYTPDEAKKLMDTATGILKVYLMLAFNTGMRSGEILGLQLGDFESTHISIKRTRTKGVIGKGKNAYAIRRVPYPSFLLDEVKKIQGNNIFLFGDVDCSGKLDYSWKKCVAKANVKRLRLYCTRHTFATLILKNEVLSINELSGVLGHTSVKTTLDRYASIINPDTIDLGSTFNLYCDTTVTVNKNNTVKSL